MSQTHAEALEEGRYILDECRRAGIRVWISERSGNILAAHMVGKPYFIRRLREDGFAVKMALQQESNEE